MVWYFHLFKNFPLFVVIHTRALAVNEAEVDFFFSWNSLDFSMIKWMWSKWFPDLQLFRIYQQNKNTDGGFRTAKYPVCDAGNLDCVKVCVSNVAVGPQVSHPSGQLGPPEAATEAVTCGCSCSVAGSVQAEVKAGRGLDESGSQEHHGHC